MIKNYLGHNFISMSNDGKENCHLECSKCKMKTYFDEDDNKFFYINGIDVIEEGCNTADNVV